MSTPPSADCTAAADGGLVLDIAAGHQADHPDRAAAAALVLIRRGTEPDPDPEQVRLPLFRTAQGRLRAELGGEVALPEGRWDVHLSFGDGQPIRLLPGLNDLRALVDRRPEPDGSPVAVRIPYATKHGNLSLRSWLRAPHAEAGEIRLAEETVTVHGRLYGAQDHAADWLLSAVVEARRRGSSLVRTALVDTDGAQFAFHLRYPDLAEQWQGGVETWDLWLCRRDHPARDEVRIGRILDDVADKKAIFTYPAGPLMTPIGRAQAGPYYTGDNDLSVRVEPLD